MVLSMTKWPTDHFWPYFRQKAYSGGILNGWLSRKSFDWRNNQNKLVLTLRNQTVKVSRSIYTYAYLYATNSHDFQVSNYQIHCSLSYKSYFNYDKETLIQCNLSQLGCQSAVQSILTKTWKSFGSNSQINSE